MQQISCSDLVRLKHCIKAQVFHVMPSVWNLWIGIVLQINLHEGKKCAFLMLCVWWCSTMWDYPSRISKCFFPSCYKYCLRILNDWHFQSVEGSCICCTSILTLSVMVATCNFLSNFAAIIDTFRAAYLILSIPFIVLLSCHCH